MKTLAYSFSGDFMTAFHGRAIEARQCVATALQSWCQQLGIKTLPAQPGMSKTDYALRFDVAEGPMGSETEILATTFGDVKTAKPSCRIVFNQHPGIQWAVRTPGGFINTVARTFQKGSDLFTFATHELGHAFGLGHIEKDEDPLSCMHSAPESDGFSNGPSAWDVRKAANFLSL